MHSAFLFYKSFYGNIKPTILCEGKTDNIYLQCAIKRLATSYATLSKFDAKGEPVLKVSFFNYSEMTHRLLDLHGGTGDIGELIKRYTKCCGKYKKHPFKHPTIIVVDNDEGSQNIFNALRATTGNKYTTLTGKTRILDKSRDFYYIAQNLYVVFTPLKATGEDTMMEDFFTSKTLSTIWDNKKFEVVDKIPPSHLAYDKNTFSKQVIKANYKKLNLNGFKPVLDRIEAALNHFYSHP